MPKSARSSTSPKPHPPFRYEGRNLLQIAMPVGGIGAGNICLNGHGGFQDFSIHHRPFTSAVPDDWCKPSSMLLYENAFAFLHLPGRKVTKLLEGPIAPEKIYDQGLTAQGFRQGNCEGFPRFDGDFPFGHVTLTDSDVPLEVRLTAFNPFIPLDDKNSGIPAAIIEYTFRNKSRQPVPIEFSFHLSHLAPGTEGGHKGSRNTVIPGRGIHFWNTEKPTTEPFGSACLMSLSAKPVIKGMWFRGGAWCYEATGKLWQEISSGKFLPNSGSNEIDNDGRNGGSILLHGTVPAGGTITYPLVVAWHFPNSDMRHQYVDGTPVPPSPAWRPFYAGVWKDARAVAEYVRKNYESLRTRTEAFKNALFSSTIPSEALNAISSNLAILKSPTVLRQENGNLWGWEGCFTDAGCCEGSCTHVWNYAQSLPHLFPKLERTLREQELLRSMDERGHVGFRAALPDGPNNHGHHAAADGQLGGILKVYRDWHIGGDTAWMKSLYPQVRRSLEYCIRTWDPDRRGLLFEPHHNTYDIEFWGPDSLCTTIYIGALSAMSAMARFLGEEKDAATYDELAERGAALMDRELFNGEYYHQKMEYKNLRDQSFAKKIAGVNSKSSEVQRTLAKEGPRFQYKTGVLSDGVLGAFMADFYGVETPLNRGNVRKTLRAIHRHNFRKDLSTHACGQRPGYAMGHEAGLLLCSWPDGEKPTLPFIYSDEVWTGTEHHVAAHLIREGMVREGLALVRATRSRYDGLTRNPFNEYECGSYYARAMASFALVAAFSGFRYSAVEQTLWLAPKLPVRPFRTFFSSASGFGTITLDGSRLIVAMTEGMLRLKRVIVTRDGVKTELSVSKLVRGREVIALPSTGHARLRKPAKKTRR
jgi:uncharacterized protein (DUF608 family)